MKFLLPLLLALAPLPALAQQAASPQIMTDVKSGDFADAQNLAAATGDPLMTKLVTFFQLLGGGGSPDELQSFIATSPDWPEQGMLAFRLAQAEGAESTSPRAEEPPFLTQAEDLHQAGSDDAAAALWVSGARAAMTDSTAAQQLLFWPAQDRLARALLMANDAKTAYAVVTSTDLPTQGATARGQIADRDFFAGFLLLRFLNQPAQAAAWFNDLLTASTAVITQARGYYWLARTESGATAAADYARAAAYPDTFYGQFAALALGDSPAQVAALITGAGEPAFTAGDAISFGLQELPRAAAYPDTFYGQLAALALGDSPAQVAALITGAGEPAFTAGDAISFGLQELPRAAALLVQMDDPQDAQIFLSRIGTVAGDDRSRELAAKLALGLGYPQSAVAIARIAGVDGQMLVREGWPLAETPPAGLEPAVALGIMRQESSFDPTAISGAGAEGLMQLMPGTARKTSRDDGIAYDNLFDPTQNMALGTAYLAGLIQQFGDCLPLAIAAYNAGPQNVANWLAENGDPEMRNQAGGANIIDWIEEIPFNETRNYVQRVTESIVVYRALQTGTADNPLTPWLTQPAPTAQLSSAVAARQ
jgi:soluble lytic murein transglycosylase